MSTISRRDLLTWFALTPTVPFFVRESARAAAGAEAAAATAAAGHDGRWWSSCGCGAATTG